MADSEQENELLRRPLYAFDLPAELLSTLVVKTDQQNVQVDLTADDASDVSSESSGNGLSCALCNVRSASVLDQRSHARSDVHRFNLKRKLRKEPAVSEVEFERMVEGLSESISGSDSSDESSEDDAADGTISTLLRKQAIISSAKKYDYDDESSKRQVGPGKPPLVWLTSPLLPPHTSLGVYRALFPILESDSDVIPSLTTRQLARVTKPTPSTSSSSPKVFLCMMGGGHFAGMIISLQPKIFRRHGQIERETVVLAHKTFHRYTTRRKQGGSQSSNDNAKGNAHSAGSTIRRYNETALITDIRELMESWRSMLEACELVFVRATGPQNRKTLFGYDEAIFKAKDPRIKKFPFSTKRATQKELMRCFIELTRLKVSHVEDVPIEAPTKPTSSTTKAATPSKPTVSKEEQALIHHTQTLTTLIRRSKAPAIITYLTTHSLSPSFSLTPTNHHTPTLLHLASSTGNPAIVLSLITSPKLLPNPADPTIPNSSGHLPYDLAADRPTRDVFRVARHELGEDRWDWSAARVGTPITRAEADAMLATEREEAEQEEKTRREQEVARLKSLPEVSHDPVITKASANARRPDRTVGGAIAGIGGVRREDDTRGLSEEAKKRLERERRARAAEERMRNMAGGS